MTTPRAAERATVVALTGGLVVYAVFALMAHRWISGLVAPLVAVLLAIRHPRAPDAGGPARVASTGRRHHALGVRLVVDMSTRLL